MNEYIKFLEAIKKNNISYVVSSKGAGKNR